MKSIFVTLSFLLIFTGAGMAFTIVLASTIGLMQIPVEVYKVLLDVVCLPLFGLGCAGLVASGQAKSDLLYLLPRK